MSDASLNPPQRDAVEHVSGPLLILAGAGSGKTRVITHRLARLVDRGVRPWRILAVTFTNKAAGEMRERADAIVGGGADRLWIGTFHSTCARLLRFHHEAAGLPRNFVIFDDADQKSLVLRVMKDLQISDRMTNPRAVLAEIDRAKNAGVGASEYRGEDFFGDLVAQIFPEYQRRLRAAGGLDFDDLLLDTLALCKSEGAGEELAARFDHVLVDEFQDTNRVQYQLVRHLSRRTGNLCVVGDDDQSIYRWRGADLRNILDFEADHPGCTTIKLEQNYRSTQTILDAANAVIARNVARKPKRLFTENGPGEPLLYFTAPDERGEARFVVSAIRTIEATEDRTLGDFAVFYRTHAQSRALEEALRSADIPYTVVGGIRFYDRAEVKDVLAYLRVVANPADEVSLERIVNVPARGIGDTTVDRVARVARASGISLWEAMKLCAGGPEAPGPRGRKGTPPRAAGPSVKPVTTPAAPAPLARPRPATAQVRLFEDPEPAPEETTIPTSIAISSSAEEDDDAPPARAASPRGEAELAPAARRRLRAFVDMIEELRGHAGDHPEDIALLVERVADRSGYLAMLSADGTDEARDRVENLAQLVGSMRDYQREAAEPSLVDWLERVSLASSVDAKTRGVSLMTVHAAKGLEFPVVFVTGLEEGTFPRIAPNAAKPREEMEEERRLAYVALTRARERLFLTNAARRQRFGDTGPVGDTRRLDGGDALSLRESRFIADIPVACVARPIPTPRSRAIPRGAAAPPLAPRRRGPIVEDRGDGVVVERDPEAAAWDDDAPVSRLRPSRAPGSPRAYDPSAPSDPVPVIDVANDDISNDDTALRCGQRVRHGTFGEGKVLALSGSGTQRKATVHFPSVGATKTVVTRFLVPA